MRKREIGSPQIAQSSLEEECAGYLLLVVGILYMARARGAAAGVAQG